MNYSNKKNIIFLIRKIVPAVRADKNPKFVRKGKSSILAGSESDEIYYEFRNKDGHEHLSQLLSFVSFDEANYINVGIGITFFSIFDPKERRSLINERLQEYKKIEKVIMYMLFAKHINKTSFNSFNDQPNWGSVTHSCATFYYFKTQKMAQYERSSKISKANLKVRWGIDTLKSVKYSDIAKGYLRQKHEK